VPDPESLEREFHVIAHSDLGIQGADILMCSEPPFFCALLSGLGKPVFGYIGNPFGAYLRPGRPQEQFYARFHGELASDTRNAFACMSPYLSALVYWHTGISLPVVRPLGLYTRATYRPSLRDILVTKQIFSAWDAVCVFNRFAEVLSDSEAAAGVKPRYRLYNGTRFVHIKHLRDQTWVNWARHRAAVFLPYDPQQMVFYELYSMNIPLLVPSHELLPMMIRFGYTNLQDFEYARPGWKAPPTDLPYHWTEKANSWELRWWSSLTDFARAPHVLRWSSVPELLRQLLHSNLEGVAAKMRRATEMQLLEATDFWRRAFFHAMAAHGTAPQQQLHQQQWQW